MTGFQVVYRNYGHWDIWQKNERIYRIRGGPSKYWVSGDHSRRGETAEFNTVSACMSYITDKLMYELIAAEGQHVEIIESWNI